MDGKGKKRKAAVFVDDEIAEINEILQSETTSRESWQIGKRLKTLIDAHPAMTKEQLGNTMCMWGTAIARIASENDDATLAEAAMDKFQQALTLLGKDEMGPYGMALFGSASMIVASEKQDRTVLEAALQQFDMAVQMDTPEAFESHFQYAKALREGSLLVQHLLDMTPETDAAEKEASFQSPATLQQKGLDICQHILEQHKDVMDGESEDAKERDDDDDEEVEDEVTKEDMSEVVLLQAQLLALLATESNEHIYNVFKQSYDMYRDNVNALIEMNAFVCRVPKPTLTEWLPRLEWIETELNSILDSLEFDLPSCYEHVMRESTLEKPKEIDERVPKLLDVLGRNLLEQLKCRPTAAAPTLLAHALRVLKCAHHVHDAFGCYSLATLYALPLYRDPTECHVWLETCESYGVLDDEFQPSDFKTMESEEWYSAFVTNGTLKASTVVVDDENDVAH
ncbi:Aste57867_9461 [Aphanomyces stellatus]|uniref:Aste57867_9461 protein n=1 Tax=Aphanomyces stellatus TaxID=120398 RepID=A0A485KN25_9STRA|nr:hypothetical protein As57867_009425 [Aphanomyces stellatus]VFT86340.1 Aste57867_9461 [Aphanomyces stellatus]